MEERKHIVKNVKEMLVFLCGFSGVGKSTLLARLASPSLELIDLDEYISLDLIEKEGLMAFRQRELMAIKQLCARQKGMGMVVALGGGALTPSSLKVIRQRGGTLIWLDTPFEECWRRIKQSDHRPLVSEGKDYLQKLYRERISLYRQSDLHLKPDAQQAINSLADLFAIFH